MLSGRWKEELPFWWVESGRTMLWGSTAMGMQRRARHSGGPLTWQIEGFLLFFSASAS